MRHKKFDYFSCHFWSKKLFNKKLSGLVETSAYFLDTFLKKCQSLNQIGQLRPITNSFFLTTPYKKCTLQNSILDNVKLMKLEQMTQKMSFIFF